MSVSPNSSDPEKIAYTSDQKTPYGDDAPVYATDTGVGQVIDAEEFAETKELR